MDVPKATWFVCLRCGNRLHWDLRSTLGLASCIGVRVSGEYSQEKPKPFHWAERMVKVADVERGTPDAELHAMAILLDAATKETNT